MRVVLRPGHGMTPPGPLAYSRYNGANRHKPDSAFPRWLLQRPGNREDDYAARFCGDYMIPALVAAGHEVDCQRALDNVTGELDETEILIDSDQFPQLSDEQTWTGPRWRINASIEAVLRGRDTRTWSDDDGWSHDPVVSCRAERDDPGDLYLSIHQNWYSFPRYYGCQVLYSVGSSRGKAYATTVMQSIVDGLTGNPWADGQRYAWGTPERSKAIEQGSRWMVVESGLWELRKTAAPAVLVELAFASNAGDAARMADPAWCRTMAGAIAMGLTG